MNFHYSQVVLGAYKGIYQDSFLPLHTAFWRVEKWVIDSRKILCFLNTNLQVFFFHEVGQLGEKEGF